MFDKEFLMDRWKFEGLKIDKKLFDAFRNVPREEFLPGHLRKYAYADEALPTIKESTISQPTTIIIMLEALELKEDDIVLELGSGTGYSAALMSRLAKKIYTLEIDPELCEYAKAHIKLQGIKNVEVLCRDGTIGLAEHAPFDKIVSTAALPDIPKIWIEQLKEGGIIVAPVGGKYSQTMVKARKINNDLNEENLGFFTFLPSKGEFGFDN